MNILIYDIETMQELFLIGIYNPDTKTYYEFEVSKDKNQLDGYMRFIEQHPEYYWVGYNNLRFDSQVIEWILCNFYLPLYKCLIENIINELRAYFCDYCFFNGS